MAVLLGLRFQAELEVQVMEVGLIVVPGVVCASIVDISGQEE